MQFAFYEETDGADTVVAKGKHSLLDHIGIGIGRSRRKKIGDQDRARNPDRGTPKNN